MLLSRRFMPWRHKYSYVIIDIRLVSKQVLNAAKPVYNLAHFGWWPDIALSQHGQLLSIVVQCEYINTSWYINTDNASNKLAHKFLLLYCYFKTTFFIVGYIMLHGVNNMSPVWCLTIMMWALNRWCLWIITSTPPRVNFPS